MSFDEVPFWRYRCDGGTTHGQCTTVYTYQDDEDDTVTEAINDAPELPESWAVHLRGAGWGIFGKKNERLLCPGHMEAAEKLMMAFDGGIPFETTSETKHAD